MIFKRRTCYDVINTIFHNHLGCCDLVRHVKDMVDNLLIYIQILTLLSPRGHGGSFAVTPGHEAKPHIYSGRLVGARKLSETLYRKVLFQKRKNSSLIYYFVKELCSLNCNMLGLKNFILVSINNFLKSMKIMHINCIL